MAAGNGLNLAVGIDLSQLQKDAKTALKIIGEISKNSTINGTIKINAEEAEKSLNSFQSRIDKLKGTFKFGSETFKFNGFESGIREVNALIGKLKASKGNGVSLDGVLFNKSSVTNMISELTTFKSAYIDAINVSKQFYRESQRRIKENTRNANANAALADSFQRLTDARSKYNSAKSSNNSKNIQDINREINALQNLIRIKEKNLSLLNGGRKGISDNELAGYKKRLDSLIAQKTKLEQINAEYGKQGGLLSRLGNLAAGYFNIYALVNFAKKVAETTGYFEKQRIALEGITGSATKANKVLTELTDFATKSPFQAKELIGFAKQLAAFSIPTDQLVGTTKKLADISAGLGVDMSRIILAYGQVRSAAVLRGQELRQFTEAGIPMVQALSDKLSDLNGRLVTTGEVFEMISKRQVSFEVVDSILSDMSSEGGKFYKMQENLSETLYGQMQKLKDLWAIALNDIGKESNSTFMGIVKFLQEIVKNAKSIGAALKAAFSAHIILKAVSAVKQFVAMIQTASLTLQAMGGWITALVGVVTYAIATIVNDTNRLNKELADIETASNKEYARLSTGLDKLIKKLESATEGTKEYNKALDALKANYGEYVNDSIINALIEERKAADEATIGYENMANAIKAAIKEKLNYDKHVERKETAGSNIVNSFTQSRFWNGFNSKIGRAVDNMVNDRLYIPYGNFNNYEEGDIDKIKNAVRYATENFFNNGLTTRDEFKSELDESAKEYAPKYAKMITGLYEYFFNIFADSEDFKTYLQEHNIIENDPRKLIEKRFQMAVDKANRSNEGRWTNKDEKSKSVVSAESTAYNPRLWLNNAQKEYTNAIKDVINGYKDENEKYIQGFKAELDALYKSTGENDKSKVISNIEAYNAAFGKLNKELDNIDGKKIEQPTLIANAIKELLDTITDPTYHQRLADISSQYIELAGTVSGVSKTIAQNITDDFMGGKPYTPIFKEFMKNYIPNEQNVNSKREELIQKYQKNLQTIKSHTGDSVWADVVKAAEDENKWIKILAGKRYYDIVDLENKHGVPKKKNEIVDFYNILKNPYDLYKKATQKGGIEAGINFMQTNQEMREVYGAMFGAMLDGKVGTNLDEKIGGKTLWEILAGEGNKNIISEGKEKGILNFQAAGKDLADFLEKYGEAKPEERAQYIRMAEQIRKWVDETFTKDEVQKWLDEFQKSVESLTNDFENMHNNIELGRKMTEMGTTGSFANVAGVDMPNLTKPRSVEQRENIGKLLANYNDWAGKATDKDGKPIAKPFSLTKDISNMNLAEIAEELRKLTDESDMNMQAFRATKEGNIMMNKLTAALKELDKTVREEAAKVSGKSATGNRLTDTIHNAGINAKNAQMMNAIIQQIAQNLGLPADQVAASARVDTAKSSADDILKAFLESNDYDTMFKAFRKPIDFSQIEGQLNELIAGLPEIERMEVQKRYNVMRGEADVFNASRGDFAPFFAGLDNYRTADGRAQEVWNKYATDSKATELGATFNADKNAWDIPETITDPEALAYLNQLNRSLDEVGKNGIKLSAIFKKQALDSVKEFASTAKNTLDSMSDVVKNLVSSVQAFVKAFNKAYDVMNDGENPKWMQDTEAFLGDFAENFEALIAPMAAVIALIIAITVAITVCEAVATPLLIVMAAVVAAAAILAAIIAAFQQHDRKLEHSIEDLKEDVEAFDRAITNLQAAAERSVGFEKLRKNIAATGKELEKATAYAEMARLEKDKKNTDDDKVKEYEQSAQESLDAFLNNLRDVRDELATATEEWADQMGSAIRSAFQNGENAARAFRNTVKTMIGDVIENMLEMAILQPLIENALENWTNSDYLRQKYTKEWTEKDENGNTIKRSSFDQDNYLKELLENIGDPDKAENFYQSMLMIGDTLIDTVNGMPSVLQDFYKYNSELGTLSGGIESVTEDTARRIEALENSQLGEVFAIRTMLQNYLEGSGFGDSMTADLQAAIASIASDTNLIRIATESILSRIDQMRNSNVQPLHVTIV